MHVRFNYVRINVSLRGPQVLNAKKVKLMLTYIAPHLRVSCLQLRCRHLSTIWRRAGKVRQSKTDILTTELRRRRHL